MTDFMYQNEAQIRKLSHLLCVKGVVKRPYDKESRKVCKFLLSYWILTEGRISREVYEKIKEEILFADASMENIIFFEKIAYATSDLLYFENYMRAMEKDMNFSDTWYTYFSKAA